MTQCELPHDPVARVRAFLDQAGYAGVIHFTDDTIFTVEDASRAVGAPPEEILKSLLLLVDGENTYIHQRIQEQHGQNRLLQG